MSGDGLMPEQRSVLNGAEIGDSSSGERSPELGTFIIILFP